MTLTQVGKSTGAVATPEKGLPTNTSSPTASARPPRPNSAPNLAHI
jgi:hypothetical protein